MRARILTLVVAIIGLLGVARPVGAVLPAAGAISHIVVINLENKSFAETFGPESPATYLNGTLLGQGVLIKNYFGTAHVSLPNYIAEVSGEAPTPETQADCLLHFDSITNTAVNAAGQVKTPAGCVYPRTIKTIADQLDALSPPNPITHRATWRAYQEDMGNNATRDGGSTCSHPNEGGNPAWLATATDGYVTRHNPFVWFHSIINNAAECQANVVPLGTLNAKGHPRSSSPLVSDFSTERSTPSFAFITPSVCNDGHDALCASPSAAGGSVGGLKAADAWLKAWMPTILHSPAFVAGSMMVVITFDEADTTQPNSSTACCGETSGPNVSAAGINGPGGGKVGALILANPSYVIPGTVDTTGTYNHYSALRTYEDLLGITSGGSDGHGHLGMAGASGLKPFGFDVFNRPYELRHH
jgi:hypothetical protein